MINEEKYVQNDEVIYHRPVLNAREEKDVVVPAMPITKPLAEPTPPPLPKKKPVFDTATLFDDDDDDEWDYNRRIPEKRLHQKVGESIDGYTKRISKSGKYYMEKDDDRNSNYRSNKWGKRRYW